jgi:hypothetical protein
MKKIHLILFFVFTLGVKTSCAQKEIQSVELYHFTECNSIYQNDLIDINNVLLYFNLQQSSENEDQLFYGVKWFLNNVEIYYEINEVDVENEFEGYGYSEAILLPYFTNSGQYNIRIEVYNMYNLGITQVVNKNLNFIKPSIDLVRYDGFDDYTTNLDEAGCGSNYFDIVLNSPQANLISDITWFYDDFLNVNESYSSLSYSVEEGDIEFYFSVDVSFQPVCENSHFISREHSFVVNAPAQPLNIIGNSNVCSGSSANYSVNTWATDYTWSLPSGASISNDFNSSINVIFGSNSGNITVTASNECGTTNPISLFVTVNPSITPSISIASSSSNIISGTNATFTATPTNGGSTPTYQWRVNGGNVGTNSNTFSSTTLVNGDVITCVLTSNAACASPTTATSNGITMTVTNGEPNPSSGCDVDTLIGTCARAVTGRPDRITSSSARLLWGTVSSDVSEYIIEYRAVGSTEWICAGSQVHPNKNLTINGLNSATSYEWRIKTKCISGGYSAWNSNTNNNFTTLAAGSNCIQTTTAPAYNITSTDATVRWSNQANTADYTLQYRVSGTSTWTNLTVLNPGTSVSQVKRRIQGLTASTTYEWQVRGNCTDGGSTNFVRGTNFTTLSGARIGQPTEEEYMAEAADKLSPARELPMIIGTYPNPVSELLNIGFNASAEQDVVITIVDMLGKQLYIEQM